MKIDPEMCVISMGENDEYDFDRNGKVFYHYTNIENLNIILKDRKFKANCSTHFKDKFEQCVNGKFKDINFVTSFAFIETEELLDDFGGENHNGVQIEIHFRNYYEEIIDLTRPIEAVSTSNKSLYNISMTNLSHDKINYKNGNSNEYKNLLSVYSRCIKPNYEKNSDNANEKALLEDKENFVINRSSSIIDSQYLYQNEVRIIFTLVATEITEIEELEYLLIPIKAEGCEKIIIKFGTNCSSKDKKSVEEIIASLNSKNIELQNF